MESNQKGSVQQTLLQRTLALQISLIRASMKNVANSIAMKLEQNPTLPKMMHKDGSASVVLPELPNLL